MSAFFLENLLIAYIKVKKKQAEKSLERERERERNKSMKFCSKLPLGSTGQEFLLYSMSAFLHENLLIAYIVVQELKCW